MKNQFVITLIFALLFLEINAQTGSKTASEVPGKWKNESAVVLNQKLTFAYYRKMFGNNTVKETVEKSIKLLDKAAVEEFSQFYFYESVSDERKREKNEKKGKDEAKIKIAVIKATGERVKVNISDAVDVDKDVPQFYRSYYVGDKMYKKIAIPNLNVGDVLDYQLEIEYSIQLNSSSSFHAFPPFYNTLAAKYPIARQEFNFMLEQGFYLNMNTYNGAPKFKKKSTGIDLKGKETEDMRTFQIVDENRDKLPKEMMSFPNTFYPSVKLQVVAKRDKNASAEGNIFTGEVDVAKVSVTPEEVAQRFNKDFNTADYYGVDISSFDKYIKNHLLRVKPFEEKVKLIYDYVKYNFSLNNTQLAINQSIKEWYFKKYERAMYPIKDFYFAVYMAKCFEKLDMKHEVIAVMPRNIGKISDLLLGEEISWIFKAEEQGKSIYLYPMNSYTTSDENRETYLYGGEAYAFYPSTKKSARENAVARKVVVPVPDPSVNSYKTKTKATFDDQLEKLIMYREVSSTGTLKSSTTPYTSLGLDFSNIYYKNYDPTYEAVKEKPSKKEKKKSKTDIELEEAIKELREKQKELMKGELEDDYEDIDSYDDFKLKCPGITEDSSTLVYQEKFKLNNLIAKAGRNYTLEIGKMLSKQPKMDEDDLKPRQSDIQMSFTKTLVNEVELTLPEGYSVEDLKELNLNIDNDFMLYKVESTLKEGKLTVKATKIYKKITAPKTDWQKVIDVFQAAYNFSQKKIILKKK
jgi:Domain of Unknown Function with PDB structure (DUF3857)